MKTFVKLFTLKKPEWPGQIIMDTISGSGQLKDDGDPFW